MSVNFSTLVMSSTVVAVSCPGSGSHSLVAYRSLSFNLTTLHRFCFDFRRDFWYFHLLLDHVFRFWQIFQIKTMLKKLKWCIVYDTLSESHKCTKDWPQQSGSATKKCQLLQRFQFRNMIRTKQKALCFYSNFCTDKSPNVKRNCVGFLWTLHRPPTIWNEALLSEHESDFLPGLRNLFVSLVTENSCSVCTLLKRPILLLLEVTVCRAEFFSSNC